MNKFVLSSFAAQIFQSGIYLLICYSVGNSFPRKLLLGLGLENRVIYRVFCIFSGMCVLQGCLRALSLVGMPLDIAASLLWCIGSVYIVFGIGTGRIALSSKRVFYLICAVLTALFIVVFGFKLMISLGVSAPLPACDQISPHTPIGVDEAGRYAFLAEQMYSLNRIPIVGQNSGQSLLAYVTSFPLKSNLYLSLLVNNVYSCFLLAFTVLQLFKRIFDDNLRSTLSGFIFLFSGTALSLSPIITMDYSYPIFLQSYSDSVYSYICLVFVISCYYQLLFTPHRKTDISLLYVMLLLAYLWSVFSSPTLILLSLNISVLFLIVYLMPKLLSNVIPGSWPTRRFLSLSFSNLLILLLVILIGSLSGSVFTSSTSLEPFPAESRIMSLSQRNGNSITPSIELLPQRSLLGTQLDSARIAQSIDNEYISDSSFRQRLRGLLSYPFSIMKSSWSIETLIINGIRGFFFPILGTYLLFNNLWGYLRDKKSHALVLSGPVPSCKEIKPDLLFFVSVISACSISLLLSTLFISVNGYKWELSRLSLPFSAIGLFAFCIFYSNHTLFSISKIRMRDHCPTDTKRIVLLTIFSVCMLSPLATALFVKAPLSISNIQNSASSIECYLKIMDLLR